MAETSDTDYKGASARLVKALDRLEASVRGLSNRMRETAKAHEEAQRLASDRNRLAGELDRAVARADRLDGTSELVSKKLDEAISTVRAVLES